MSLSIGEAEPEEEGWGSMVGSFSSSRCCSTAGASKPLEFAWILTLPLRNLIAVELHPWKREMAGNFEIPVLEGAVEINEHIFPSLETRIQIRERDEECMVSTPPLLQRTIGQRH